MLANGIGLGLSKDEAVQLLGEPLNSESSLLEFSDLTLEIQEEKVKSITLKRGELSKPGLGIDQPIQHFDEALGAPKEFVPGIMRVYTREGIRVTAFTGPGSVVRMVSLELE